MSIPPNGGPALRVLMITSEWPSEPGHTAHFIARQARFLSAAGVRLEVFTFRGGRHPLRYLAAWVRLRRRLARERYDIVHAQFGQSGLLALPKRLPLVVTFRGDDLQGIVGREGRYLWSGRVLRAASRIVARVADRIVVVAASLAHHLPGSRAYHVIPSGL